MTQGDLIVNGLPIDRKSSRVQFLTKDSASIIRADSGEEFFEVWVDLSQHNVVDQGGQSVASSGTERI